MHFFPSIENGLSYGDHKGITQQHHHQPGGEKAFQLFKQPSHLDCLLSPRAMERKIDRCKILIWLCIPSSLPHSQLSTLQQQLTVVFHKSHYPLIIDPSGLQSTLEPCL